MGRILLLEPDLPLANSYKSALEFSGHEVTACHDAQSAVAAIDESLPEIIISELQLAMHNGIEFLYELRSYSDTKNIPVLILSSLPVVDKTTMDSLWKNLKISAYYYKPLTKLHELVTSIEHHLSAKV